MGEVINAAHLFRREPSPTEERSRFWTWGRAWVDDGINNLEAIFADVQDASSEEELRRALSELRDEVQTYPLDDD